MAGCISTTLVVVAHLLSVHSQPGFNDRNPGLGLGGECETSENLYFGGQGGVLKNSEDATSVYLGGTIRYEFLHRLDIGAICGGITGYERADVLPFCAIGPGIWFTENFVGRVSWLPGVQGSPHAGHFTMGYTKRF